MLDLNLSLMVIFYCNLESKEKTYQTKNKTNQRNRMKFFVFRWKFMKQEMNSTSYTQESREVVFIKFKLFETPQAFIKF